MNDKLSVWFGPKAVILMKLANDCLADFSAGRRCSEIRFNTTSCFRILTRQCSMFSRNRTFKGVKQAEIQTGHSLRPRPMSHMRTKPPDAGVAKIALIARRCRWIAQYGVAGFTESRPSNHANRPKSNPDIRCAPVLCLTCGLTGPNCYAGQAIPSITTRFVDAV